MNTTIRFVALLLIGTLCFADTPPIIYQFAAPLVKTGGKNVSIPKADSTHDGYLSQTDFNSFTGFGTLAGDVTGASSSNTIATGAVTDTKASLANKPAVTVVATTNQALLGTPTIDGQTTTANQSIVLLTAQSTGSQNGPWVVQSGSWTRPTWYPNGGTTQAFQFITTLVRLGSTYSGTVWRCTTAAPITIGTTATTWVITRITLNSSTATQATSSTSGFLSAADWTTFNNKLDASRFNYITNPDAEVNTAGWNLYSDIGRTTPAFVVDQDITFTSTSSGNTGNGQTVNYVLGSSPYAEPPIVTCPTGNSVQIAWYNGPTISQNPTATVLKAAWDASCAATMATATITGTASHRQYITGLVTLGGGGDTAPTDGTGGVPSDLTFTRSTSSPLVGTASFLETKGTSSQQGNGVSTDFTINSADKGNPLQISFYYSGDAGMVFGTSSDVKVFLYDVTNNVMLPITSRSTLAGPTANTIYRYAGQFTASSSSVLYRLILHTSTSNATAWNFKLDSVTVSPTLDASAATQVPQLTLPAQPITAAVNTDNGPMAVMWQDGNTAWKPATMAAGADASTLFGFATNIVGLTADITLRGTLSGFSIGPFLGYNQYVDSASAGSISPAPATFTDAYVVMGKGLSSDTMMVEPHVFNRLVTSKGGLLTNGGLNNGTGDVVVAGGTTGQFLRYNTGLTNGFSAFTPVGTAPIVYTAATSAWSCTTATASVAGCLAAADFTTFNAKAPTASPTFTGTPLSTTAVAGTNTTQIATTAFVTTADNLKANIASPTLTGDVTLSTGNLLISTIGKGPQIKTGTNAKIGTAVLVGGTVTVANTSVTANSRIFLTSNTDGGTPGFLRVSTKTVGTSFVITSSSGTDTSTVAWMIIESIP